MSAAEFLFVGIPGRDLDAATAALLTRFEPGGVILFQRNIRSAEQLLALVGELRRVVPRALLAIDGEGGRVDRLKEVVGPAPAASWLARRPPTLALAAGRWMAKALRLFDLDMDLAPVVDVDRGERGNALDGRYHGPRTSLVTPRARAFLRGLHSGGVGGCIKHFPGLGAAAADTHQGLARIDLEAAELELDLRPFASLMSLAGAVMAAHAIYPAYDVKERPASLSSPVLQGLLRDRLGFSGLTLSDDLEMKALAEWGDLPERAEAAFAAGCDVVLVSEHLDALPEIAARLEKRRLAERRRQARERLEIYRQRVRTLRWAGESVSLLHEPRRKEQLEIVRQGLAALQPRES
jgi:beta-N-acetylhexosaminidase